MILRCGQSPPLAREPIGDRGVIGQWRCARTRWPPTADAGVQREVPPSASSAASIASSTSGPSAHTHDPGVILGRRANHRRAADVDVLHAIGEGLSRTDGRLERIEVDPQQIDRRDVAVGHGPGVLGRIAHAEQSSVDGRMQGLDPHRPSSRRRSLGFRRRGDRQAGGGDGGPGSRFGGDELDAQRGQPARASR